MDWKWLIVATLAGILMGWWDCHHARSQDGSRGASPTPLQKRALEPYSAPYGPFLPASRPPLPTSLKGFQGAKKCWYVEDSAGTSVACDNGYFGWTKP